MLKNHLSFFILPFISFLMFTSCNKQVDLADLTGKKWILTAMDYENDVYEPIEEIFIEFTDTETTGSGGCNAFFAEYTLTENQFEIIGLSYTEMACEAEIMEIENKFFELLRKSENIELSGNNLIIFCDGGELKFKH